MGKKANKVGLVTDFVTLGTAGKTVDGRTIPDEWLEQAAAAYDCAEYTAVINSDHELGWYGSFGQVRELRAAKDAKGRTILQGRLEPNSRLLQMSASGQRLFLSMEIQPDFADSGQAYLIGLAITDMPASLGTTELRFSQEASAKAAANNQFRASTVELAPEAFSAAPGDSPAPASDEARTFLESLKKLFAPEHTTPNEKETHMTPEQLKALTDGQTAQTEALSKLTEAVAKLSAKPAEGGDGSNEGQKNHQAEGGEGGKKPAQENHGTGEGKDAETLSALLDGQKQQAAALETLTQTLASALNEGKGQSFGKGTGAADGEVSVL
jgi:hypothetical protein